MPYYTQIEVSLTCLLQSFKNENPWALPTSIFGRVVWCEGCIFNWLLHGSVAIHPWPSLLMNIDILKVETDSTIRSVMQITGSGVLCAYCHLHQFAKQRKLHVKEA